MIIQPTEFHLIFFIPWQISHFKIIMADIFRSQV